MTFIDELTNEIESILEWILNFINMIIDIIKIFIEVVDNTKNVGDLLVYVIPIILTLYVSIKVFRSIF